MLSLGIHCGHDSSMAIAKDGKILFACEEERLTGSKKETGFPARSVIFGCQVLGIGLHDFDKVVYSQKGNFFYRVNEPINFENTGLYKDAIYMDHHYAHAVSAYSLSGFGDCLVMTLDGGGDDKFATIWEAKDGKLTKVSDNKLDIYPFGVFYNQVTEACGFTPNRHEGKVMGLAARGIRKDIFDGMFDVDGDQIKSIGKMDGKYSCENIVKTRLLKTYPDGVGNIYDMAASAQKTFEEVILKWIENNAKGRDLVVAGGSFANVLANMKIAKLVNRYFVAPPMFDDGLSIGAALSVYDTLPTKAVDNMYLGFSSPARGENRKTPKAVAEMVASGAIVGLFQGRMEYGPRALGNRSIIADPRRAEINNWLNKRLKRSEFMPFAPVILKEYAEEILVDYHVGIDNAPYMTSCWEVKDEWKPKLGAVVHIDGTARPQVIDRETNEFYYDVIEEFRKITGIPAMINTSFNGHESPIVCFPQEADRMLNWGMIDVLVEN